MRRAYLILLCAVLVSAIVPAHGALRPENVAVVVNQLSDESKWVGRYYCDQAGIPETNLIEVQAPDVQAMDPADYPSLAEQIRSALVNELHVDPGNPDGDPIQVLVMCYGLPSILETQLTPYNRDRNRSVDSYLALLFSTDPDLTPTDMPGLASTHVGCANPYANKDMDFEAFRASPYNTINYGGQTYKMRYMVCRLDAYRTHPSGTPYGDIPGDVKALIDRSVLSCRQPNQQPPTGRFVLDEPWWSIWGNMNYNWAEDALKLIVNQNLVVHDRADGRPDGECYVKMFDDPTGVMGYASFGMHDPAIAASTEWGRPYFNWKPGAVCVIGESYSGSWLRGNDLASWDGGTNTCPTLEVTAGKCDGVLEKLTGYRIVLLDSSEQPVKWTRNGQPADVEAYVDSAGIAQIDVGDPTIEWPQGQGAVVLIRGYFPADDHGYHDGEPFTSDYACTDLSELKTTGLKLTAKLSRQKIGEYIRCGCSGGPANVSEPYGEGPIPNTLLPRYARGYSWAEAAWMGTAGLAGKALVIGDPLMAPYTAQPTAAFVSPTPADGSTVKGSVTLCVSAEPEGASGQIGRVDFWLKHGGAYTKIGCDEKPPYRWQWDTEELRQDSSYVYEDGEYTVQAVAYQTGSSTGLAVAEEALTVAHSAQGAVSITEPDADWGVLTESAPAEVQVEGSPSRVEYWLFGGGAPALGGTASTSPYQCTIPASAAADGLWNLQAVAHYGSPSVVAYSPTRLVAVMNDGAGAHSVGSLIGKTDGSPVFLLGVPVTSGTSAVNDGAFYVEDESRAAGIQVRSSETIATGQRVDIGGILHTASGERYIETDHPVHDVGVADIPTPVCMPSRNIGGDAPAGIVDVSGGFGLYNTGVLVTLTGWVWYTDDDYSYLDDGSILQTGVSAYEPRPVPMDGTAVPSGTHAIHGIRLYCPEGVEKPGSCQLITVTGISSFCSLNGVCKPMLRVPDADSIQYVSTYHGRAFVYHQRLIWADGSNVPAHSLVRLENQSIIYNSGSDLLVEESSPGYLNSCASILPANTALQEGDSIIVVGEYLGPDEYGMPLVQPEAIYLTASGSQQLLGGSSSLMAGESLSAMDSVPMQEDAISTALAQANGTSVSLSTVQVADIAGGYFGVKGMSESLTGPPRLLVARTGQVGQSWIVDVQGTITTLAGGQRAIVPASVWLYTDANGHPSPPYAWMVGSEWPYKMQIQ